MMRLVKTATKYLARMEGCCEPEFEPCIEEIMDYRWDLAILSVRFFGKVVLCLFILAHNGSRLRPGQPAHAACPNIIQFGVCAVGDVSKVGVYVLELYLFEGQEM